MEEELENEYLRIEEDIVAALRTVYDPEIPVNVYDLGLIYCVELTDGRIKALRQVKHEVRDSQM